MEIGYYEMSEEDIPEIARLELKYFSQPWPESSIASYMEKGNTLFIVAKHGQKIVGYMALMRILDESDLVSIAVDEDYRRMGIAKEILDIGYEMARDNGVEKIHLEVRESNSPAIALYENEGFVQDGRRRGFYEKPREDALLYTKQL